jgi:uncharacterized RDD family membrane protein YckC
MSEQPPFGNYPPPQWGSYPPAPPGTYPPVPHGSYPPSYGAYPPPPAFYPPVGSYPPGGYPPQAPSGHVTLPGIGTVAVATIWQRLLARLIDSLICGVFYAVFLILGVALVASTLQTSHTVTDHHGHATSEPSGLGMLGFFLAFAVAMGSGLLYEWLMLAYKGATLGKMALGIKVVNQSTGQILGYGPAFVRPLVPLAASLFCSLLTLLVYLSPLFYNSGRLQGWHDRAANDLVIKVR